MMRTKHVFGLTLALVPLYGQTPVLNLSTTYSGYGASSAQAVTYGSDGSIFVAGYTEAANYPVVAPGRASAGGVDAVVTKIAADGSRTVWSTHLGGKAEDRALALAPDGLGGVYIAGFTTSTNFSIAHARQSTLKGARDAFLTRVSSTGAIVFSTYFGGTGSESAYALAADASGVWIAGVTDSTDFPLLAAYQTVCKGRQDGFFARFTPAGTLVTSSYAGASGEDIIRSAATIPGGVLVLGGGTDSPDWGFSSGAQKAIKGEQDGFVLAFDASGAVLVGGTYLGGSGGLWTSQETVYGIAVTPDGLIWAGGATPSQDFPRSSSWRTASTDLQDAYLVQLDAKLEKILVSSLVGGTQRESVLALTVDGDGTLYATGFTTSFDFPLVAPTQSAFGGSRDAFLLRWPKSYAAPDFSTFVGGRGSDTGQAIAAFDGNVTAAGISDSSNFPQLRPLQLLVGSNAKVFVTEHKNMKSNGMPIVLNAPTPSSGQGGAGTFRFSASHTGGASKITQLGLALSPDTTLRNACAVRYIPSTGKIELADASGVFGSSVRLNSADVASNTACLIFGSGSSALSSGNKLEVNVSMIFLPSFAGAKNLLVSAQGGLALGPVSKGSWTIPTGNTAPFTVAVTPPASGGTGGVFSVLVADAQGSTDLSYGYLLINKTYSSANACMIVLDHQWRSVYLGNDSMTGWMTAALGENKALENSQCRLKAASSRITYSGSLATYMLDVEFTNKNLGVNTIWSDTTDKAGAGSGLKPLGSYEVKPAAAALTLGSPKPASGEGNAQTFSFSASHTSGSAAITESALSISPGMSPSGGCTVRYLASSGSIQLADTSGVYKWTVRPGTTDVASSTVCTLYGAASSVSKSAVAVETRVGLVFSASFAGTKSILQSAAANSTIGWQSQGMWTVAGGNAAPGVLRFAPAATSSSITSFDLIVADPQGVGDVTYTYGLLNSSFAVTNACMFLIDRTWKAIYLLNDAGSAWASAFLGENKLLENSQCRVHVASSTQLTLGEATRFKVDLSFKPTFVGGKRFWGSVLDGGQLSSGWIDAGSFTAQ